LGKDYTNNYLVFIEGVIFPVVIGCDFLNIRNIGWLWECFNCGNQLRMSAKMELRWDNEGNECCLKSMRVLRERITETDVKQNQIRTVQSLLLNKFIQIEDEIELNLESEISDLDEVEAKLESRISDLDEPNQTEKKEYGPPRVDGPGKVPDRSPQQGFNDAWDESPRLTPGPEQCKKCGGNLKPRGDSLICRKCGDETFDL